MIFENLAQFTQSATASPVGLEQSLVLFLHLSGAALLGAAVALLYFLTHRTKPVGFSFLLSLPLLSIITGFVISVIGNDLIRAFGLIGAISMVRFRTRVERTLDMAYIFMAIGLGLACGVGLVSAAVAGLLIFGITVSMGSIIKKSILAKRKQESTDEKGDRAADIDVLTSDMPFGSRRKRKSEDSES